MFGISIASRIIFTNQLVFIKQIEKQKRFALCSFFQVDVTIKPSKTRITMAIQVGFESFIS